MTTRDTLKVAAAQYPIGRPASLDAWRDNVARWVEQGAATGASLLVFPEMQRSRWLAAFGAEVSGNLEATLTTVANLEHERLELHRELAALHKVHILVGSGPSRRAQGVYVNAAQLVTPDGAVGVQEKHIMTPFERDWGITPGDGIRVFDTALARIGIAICYDSEFPLLVRGMAEAGAEIVLIPSCTERISGYHRVRTGAKARALENQIATVLILTVGDALWSPAVDRNTGAAGIFVLVGADGRRRRRAGRGHFRRTPMGERDGRHQAAARAARIRRDAQLLRLGKPAGRVAPCRQGPAHPAALKALALSKRCLLQGPGHAYGRLQRLAAALDRHGFRFEGAAGEDRMGRTVAALVYLQDLAELDTGGICVELGTALRVDDRLLARIVLHLLPWLTSNDKPAISLAPSPTRRSSTSPSLSRLRTTTCTWLVAR